MKIPLVLNGKDVVVDVPPEKRLVDVLREDLGLLETKARCYRGECGFCSVLLDNQVQLSCIIPIFSARNATIVTMEGFKRTKDFSDIIKGFKTARYQPCEYCLSGRIFLIHDLLQRTPYPIETEIVELSNANLCRCSDLNTFIDAVISAAKYRRERSNERKK